MSSNVVKFDKARLGKGGDTANEGNSRNPIGSTVSVPGIHKLGDADLVRHFGNSEIESETSRSQEKGTTQREITLRFDESVWYVLVAESRQAGLDPRAYIDLIVRQKLDGKS